MKNTPHKKTIADLNLGEKATITHFNDINVAAKFMEMGCRIQSQITVVRQAPLGCPLYILLPNDKSFALRKKEAQTIEVSK